MNVTVRRSLQPLQLRYAEPLRRAVTGLWTWWSGHIISLLPGNLRDAIARRQQKLFVDADDQSLQLSLGTNAPARAVKTLSFDANETAAADLPRDAQQSILLMPSSKVLSKLLTLPMAAEENLREVLGFEMDQHTPFAATRVYFDFVVTNRDSRRQELTVNLVYAPRSEVDDLLSRLDAFGIDVDVITSRGKDGTNLRNVNLLPREQRRNKRITIRRLNLGLTAVCAALLTAVIALPIVQKDRAIADVQAQVEAAATAAREGNQLRRDLESLADASRFLALKKQTETMAVQLIDEVSRILPDHTWIARLDLSDTELELQGQSASSSSLIKLMEASPYFENVRFRSPVVQVPGTDYDRFHLSADIVRRGKE